MGKYWDYLNRTGPPTEVDSVYILAKDLLLQMASCGLITENHVEGAVKAAKRFYQLYEEDK